MFEKNINELKEIVEKLEKGDVSLDDSIELFEKGMRLAKDAGEALDKAEKRVKMLLNGQEEDFSPEE